MRAPLWTLAVALPTLALALSSPMRSSQPEPPSPFAVRVIVRRAPIPPPPAPLAVRVTVQRRSAPPPPAPFPLRVSVRREALAEPPAPFPIHVTVARQVPPPPPAPFSVLVAVTRRAPPPPPKPFAVRVAVAREALPPAPPSFPVRVTVHRREPPSPPAPLAVRVTVTRPDPSSEIADLLAELRRLESASAIEWQEGASAAEALERDLETIAAELGDAAAGLERARAAAAAAEPLTQRIRRLLDRIRAAERTAALALPAVTVVADEVCAAAPTTTVAALAPKVDAADATADDIARAATQCGQLLAEAEEAAAEWFSTWRAARPPATETLEGVAASLAAAEGPLGELGFATGRLGELDAEAAPQLDQVEERTAAWNDPALESFRQEVLTEAQDLAERIGARAREALDRHERLHGTIANQENELALLRSDLAAFRDEANRIDQGGRAEIEGRLEGAREICERAETHAASAADAVSRAYACLERLTAGTQAAAATERITVPELRSQSEPFASAWLADLGLTPLVRDGSPTPVGGKPDSVESQSPSAGHQLERGATVTLRVFRGSAPASTPTVATQAGCDEQWPGTLLTPQSDGSFACLCPRGTAWSKVQRGCLALLGDDSGLVADSSCSDRPGTLYDERTGECRCPIGSWNAAEGRCVDTAAAEREKRVGDLQKGAQCERLYSDIEVFASHPEPLYRQMATTARQRAAALGCDSGRVAAAEAASTRFGTPPGATGSTTASGATGTGSTSDAAGTTSGSGGLCVLTDIDYTHVGTGGTAYFVYRNPSNAPGRVPEVYGVLSVPTRIKSGDQTTCSSGRQCLQRLTSTYPFQILGEHPSRSAAAAETRRRCPNPVHTSNY